MSILKESIAFKPFQYEWAFDLTVLHEELHWVESEVDLSSDVYDWKEKLSEKERAFVTNILRLFTQSDVQVGANYHDFLIPRIKNNEARNMLTSFAAREGVHQRAYALLNETLGLPDEEFHAFLSYTEMANKIDFMKTNDSSTLSGLALSLAQSVFNEGVSLFASFAMLLNFERFNKVRGLTTIVAWSIRDESLHVQGNAKLFRALCEEHPRIVNDEMKSKIYAMAKNVVSLEDKFIQLVYKDTEIQGLACEDVKQYIRHITDRRLLQLGLKTKYRAKDNPLEWVDHIVNGASHENFFEGRSTQYSVNGMSGDWGWDSVITQERVLE